LRSLFLSLIVHCHSALGCVCLCVPIGNLIVITHPNVGDNLIPLRSCLCYLLQKFEVSHENVI
jgi:hypothetical protein